MWLCRPGATDDPCEASTASTTISPTNALTVVPGRSADVDAQAGRLLVRLPDRQHSARAELRPHDRAGRTIRRPSAGITVLVRLQRLGAHVPPGDGFVAGERAGPRQGRRREPPRGLGGLPPARQRRPTDRLPRPQPGIGDADRPLATGHRQRRGVAGKGRVRGHPRRQRPGADRQGRRGHLPTHPRVPIDDPDDMRHRILDVPRPTTRRRRVRDPRSRSGFLSGQTERDGVAVLCTNPANLSDSAATAPLLPYFWIVGARPQLLSTDWVAVPSLYTAECHDNDGASWLQVNDIGTASDIRTRLQLTNGPACGVSRRRRQRCAG